jgi:hypothetical protein
MILKNQIRLRKGYYLHKTQFSGMRRCRNDKRITDNTNDNTRKNNDPKKQIAIYALNKIIKYKCNKYSAYLFITLDDTASSELISKNDSPIIRLLNVCRYIHISCAICVQTVRDSFKELKRMRFQQMAIVYQLNLQEQLLNVEFLRKLIKH